MKTVAVLIAACCAWATVQGCGSGTSTTVGAGDDGGSSSGHLDTGSSGSSGASGSSGDPAGCTGCTAQQICAQGKCQDLPAACPCPLESYCELSTNTCKVGCAAQGQCSSGRYCDLESRTCKTGCLVDDAECGQGKICQAHACVLGCRSDAGCGNASLLCEGGMCVAKCTSCPDDGNLCTTDTCVRDKCVHAPVTNGTACAADTNECTVDSCQSGMCAHLAATVLTICDKANTPNNGMFTPEARACTGTSCATPKQYCAKHVDGKWYLDRTGAVTECSCNGTSMVVRFPDNVSSTKACTRCDTTTVPDSGNGSAIPFVGCW